MSLLKSAHGGNTREAAELLGILPEQLLDFSANINPLGMPVSLKRANYRQSGLHGALPGYRLRATACRAGGASSNSVLVDPGRER